MLTLTPLKFNKKNLKMSYPLNSKRRFSELGETPSCSKFLLLNFGEFYGNFLWMPPSTWRNSLWVASDWVAMPVPWICAKFCRRPRGGGVKLPFLKCFPDPLPFNEGDLLVEKISETYWPASSRRRMFFIVILCIYLYYIMYQYSIYIYMHDTLYV